MPNNKNPDQDKLKIVQDAASNLILFLLKIDDFSKNKKIIDDKIKEYIEILNKNGSGRSNKNIIPKITKLIETNNQEINFNNISSVILSSCGNIRQDFYENIVNKDIEYNLLKNGKQIVQNIINKESSIKKEGVVIPGLDTSIDDLCCQTHMGAMSIIAHKINKGISITNDEKIYLGGSNLLNKFGHRNLGEDIEWRGMGYDFITNMDLKYFLSNPEKIKSIYDVDQKIYINSFIKPLIAKLATKIVLDGSKNTEDIHKEGFKNGGTILSQQDSMLYALEIAKNNQNPVAFCINQGEAVGGKRQQKIMETIYYKYNNEKEVWNIIEKPNNKEYCMIFDVVAGNNVDNIEKYLKDKINNNPDTFIMDCFASIEPFPQKTEDQKKMYKQIDRLHLNISPITDKLELRFRHSYLGTPFELEYKKDHSLEKATEHKGDVNNSFVADNLGTNVENFKRRAGGVSYSLKM